MPSDHSAVMRGLAEELVVPEANGSAQELRRGNGKSRMPEQIMKAGRDSPRAKGMKKHMIGIARFVGVVLMK